MSQLLTTVAAAAGADDGGGPPPPIPSGDITATDPLGLSVGQDVAWTIDPADPPPPSGGVKSWNPGHYLHVQGQPWETVQNSGVDYFDKVATQIDNNLGDIPEIVGAHYAIAWGQVNPTGNTFDFSDLDTLIAQVAGIGNRKSIIQVQYKTFRNPAPNGNIEAPADLANEIEITASGHIAGVWRSNVNDRYIACMQAIGDRYEGDDRVEMVLTNESAPSFGGGFAPSDYTAQGFLPELKRMYAEVGAHYGTVNFAPNINFLGGSGAGNLSWELIEEVYQLRLFTGGPDVGPTAAWLNFEGLAAGTGATVPPRDYRKELGVLYTFSAPILIQSGKTPGTLINDMQLHQSTHYSWVAGAGEYSWQDIKDAIQADPAVNTDCPLRYLEGCAV